MKLLNNNWQFIQKCTEEFIRGKGEGEDIRLPHNVCEMPLHYCDNHSYEMISGYRRKIEIPQDLGTDRLFLQFDGVGHVAEVFLNGEKIAEHKGGYTAFRAEITPYVSAGEQYQLAVRVDSRESINVPPFGFVIDYLTYGGIYRSVWLDRQPAVFVEDVFVTTPETDRVKVRATVNGLYDGPLNCRITDREGNILSEQQIIDGEGEFSVPQAKTWSPKEPNLYYCHVSLANGIGEKCVRFGFRTLRYDNDGVMVNDEKITLRGLNRHQCYPYIGYAVVDSLQREDARILKEELAVNAVRTSHYPQSQAFIDACDELGLLVFTEIPGWQHIGNREWKDISCQNVREMVTQYRNHPSIFMWGVRINESNDDDEFYEETNRIAHQLDDSRATSGVRCITDSSLLEDVYAYNDFSHVGNNPGVIDKKKVTQHNRPLMISEANGHMYPTKSFDTWIMRQNHALRHARVLNDALADGNHMGVFTWCMFDYPTHKDFGSGDRVCYHGVMDAFRNPKLAASVFAMQGDKPVLEIGSNMAWGDYPASVISDVYAFSNADTVKLYKNGKFVTDLPATGYTALKAGPRLVDDIVGELLKSEEGLSGEKEQLLHEWLKAATGYGYGNLPAEYDGIHDRLMNEFGLCEQDFHDYYGDYIGNWGGEAIHWRFDAVKDGTVVASRTVGPTTALKLETAVSADLLHEGDCYDMAAVRIRVVDEYGNVASYAQLPVKFTVQGDIEIIGPDMTVSEGGMCGTYVKTTGKAGKGSLLIECPQLESVKIDFTIEKDR